jgi:hypothetical protein
VVVGLYAIHPEGEPELCVRPVAGGVVQTCTRDSLAEGYRLTDIDTEAAAWWGFALVLALYLAAVATVRARQPP